jgi:hypothetical protein
LKKAKCLLICNSSDKFARGTKTTKKLKHIRKRGGKTNRDIDQCVDIRRILNRHVNEIESLSLQKLAVTTVMGFSDVPSPSLMLLLVMVIVVPVATTVHE